MPGTRRVQVSVSVSAEAHDAMVEFCTQQGVTITAMLEAIMLDMAALNEGAKITPHMRGVIDTARREAARRRYQ